jgi:LmbE family N-acetylglucosaminyl deacetylase
MAVHAHPDDEASSTGGLLARCAAEGVRTVLVTCTNGELGDAPGGVKPGAERHVPREVAAARRVELERSCEILGVSALELLDYRDSGMAGWPSNDAPGSFWTTPVEHGATRVAGLMERWQPDVVVTYDANGFYGHPDHIQAHRITVSAFDRSPGPAKLYCPALPRSGFSRFRDQLVAAGVDLPPVDGPDIAVDDEEITTVLDCRAFAQAKHDALAAHQSQSENMFFLQMPRPLFDEMFGVEHYVRLRDRTGGALPEDDLFAGLRDRPSR